MIVLQKNTMMALQSNTMIVLKSYIVNLTWNVLVFRGLK